MICSVSKNHINYNKLPDSFKVTNSAGVKIFKYFLFNIFGVHLVKHRAKNETDSAFTDGFLLFIAFKTSSWMDSSDIYNNNTLFNLYISKDIYNYIFTYT